MLYINPARVQTPVLHNLANYLLSDSGSVDRTELLTCELPPTQRVTSRYIRLTELSPSGENSIVISTSGSDDVNFRAVAARVLRLVVSRRPVAHQPYPESAPDYLLAYVVETLECGHSQDIHFAEGAENLIAKRRVCAECGLSKKKPVQSVRFPAQKSETA